EPAAHPPADTGHLVLPNAQAPGHDRLDFRGVLGGGVDRHRAAFAGHGDGRLRLQVKMLLTAAAEVALQTMVRLRPRGSEVAALNPADRPDELSLPYRLINREDGRQLFQLQAYRRLGRLEGRLTGSRQDDDGLTEIMAFLLGQ